MWIEDLMNQYGKLKIAREANELDDNHKMLAMDRAVVEAHHKRNLGSDYSSPAANDMIHIGDQVQHPPQTKSMGWLGQLLIGLGLAGTGAGMGIGGTLIADAIKSAVMSKIMPTAPPVQPVAPVIDDKDTQFELRLGTPAKE